MRRVSRIEFLKNVHSGNFSNAFTAFLFSFGSVDILRKNLRSIGNNSSIDCHDDERRKLKRRFDVVMCRLKKDGMIKEDGHITKRGIIFLSSIIGRESKYLPTRSYQHGKSDTITLVTFDIPEKYKRYREWLRFVLRDMGFSMLQRSVWIGKVKIPKEFLTDLKNTKMIPFVEIVEISKLGSVERISNAG